MSPEWAAVKFDTDQNIVSVKKGTTFIIHNKYSKNIRKLHVEIGRLIFIIE